MKRNMILTGILSLLLVFGFGMVMAGCATKIPLQVRRMPTLDTTGIQRIAIMPFTTSNNNSIYQNVATHATTVSTSKIQETNAFTLVNAQEIQRLQRANQSIENHVDALFIGQIARIAESTEKRQREVTNRETGITTKVDYYYRVVEVQLNYSMMRARDGSLLGPINKTGRRSVTADSQGDLKSVEALARDEVNWLLRQLARDVAPYTIRITRTLEKDPNKDLQPQMDAALAQVKEGSYKQALDSYLGIYQANGSVAAAINASILYEALGETQTALIFMQGVYSATGNPKANTVINMLRKELQEAEGVSGHDESQSQTERVANNAINEVMNILPYDARVWILNNDPSNQIMVNDVVDNMTSAFLRNGITVVDRANIDKIMAEQNFQMGGNVNDNEFVSIGNLAGANIVVIINVTGTGGNRRLQVRVIDIERGIPIFQSDTSEGWRL